MCKYLLIITLLLSCNKKHEPQYHYSFQITNNTNKDVYVQSNKPIRILKFLTEEIACIKSDTLIDFKFNKYKYLLKDIKISDVDLLNFNNWKYIQSNPNYFKYLIVITD